MTRFDQLSELSSIVLESYANAAQAIGAPFPEAMAVLQGSLDQATENTLAQFGIERDGATYERARAQIRAKSDVLDSILSHNEAEQEETADQE